MIKDFKKYDLLSPEVDDTSNINLNFIDQQRFLLANGDYDLEITLTDKNNTMPTLKTTEKITIDFPPNKITVSIIQLVESYKQTNKTNILSKSGYDIVPYISNFYPQNINKLTFYSEIYKTKED